MTQASSAPRIKTDTLGESTLIELYAAYEQSMKLEDFKSKCHGMIDKSTAVKTTKLKFHHLIDQAYTHDKVLATTQNFILAGMGLGV
jgi:hypothetical protein